MALVREKATVEKHLALDRQRQQLGGPPGRNPSGGPTQSRKETGFDKDIDVIDTKDYGEKQSIELPASLSPALLRRSRAMSDHESYLVLCPHGTSSLSTH